MLGHLEDLSMSPFSDRTDFLTAAGLFQQAFALSSEEDSLRTKNLEDLAAVMYKSYKAFDQQTDLCLLYTSDAADDLICVDLGCRRYIKKKKTNNHNIHQLHRQSI